MNKINNQRAYSQPIIEQVKLDTEISLILESSPPGGPNEPIVVAPEHFNNDPFKTNIG